MYPRPLLAITSVLLACSLLPLRFSAADIYQWEWIDAADHSLGRQQSATLTPDGAGRDALPHASLNSLDLTLAWLHGADLNSARFDDSILDGADFSQANLFDAIFNYASLTGANFSHSNLTESYFHHAILTEVNLRNANLTNIGFYNATLTDVDFNNADLTDASFYSASITNVDFSGAEVRGASFHTDSGFKAAHLYSTASYQAGDLSGISLHNDLAGWDFSGLTLASVNFSYADLASADFSGADLQGAKFIGVTGFTSSQLNATENYQVGNLSGLRLSGLDLTGWDFSGKILTDMHFSEATLTDVDFTGAEIGGAFFEKTTDLGFTAAQLYSTASYQANDISGVWLWGNDLTGWDFAGQKLSKVVFGRATLTNANFSGADVRDAYLFESTEYGFTAPQLYSTASYQDGDLSGISLSNNDLSNWDLSGQNLTSARLNGSILTGVDFTGAVVRGAVMYSTTNGGFSAEQLYSTASYQEGNLTGLWISRNDLTDWDFSSQKLSNASFDQTTLNNADFSGANITEALFRGATLSNTDFSHADTRGASNLSLTEGTPNTQNTIFPDGAVYGLDIQANETMRLWDYDAETPLPIEIQEGMQIDAAGMLRVEIEDGNWGSTLTFVSGIDVLLDGTLELLVEPDEETTLASLVGTTFALFDWTGVTPTGSFSQIQTESELVWDTSNLYTTGEVTLVAAVPEPGAWGLAMLGLVGMSCWRCGTV